MRRVSLSDNGSGTSGCFGCTAVGRQPSSASISTAALTVTRAKAWSCASFIIARSIRAFSLPDEEFFPIVPTSLLRLGPTRELCGDGSGRPEESRPYSILETTGVEVDNLPPNRDSGGGWVPAVFRPGRGKGPDRSRSGPLFVAGAGFEPTTSGYARFIDLDGGFCLVA